jgi:hypothetical protein
MAALRAMRNDAAMVLLEAVAMEAAKIAVRELRDGVVAPGRGQRVDVRRQRRGRGVAHRHDEAWLLVNDDETEVEDEDKEAEAAAERDPELRAAAEKERIAEAEAEKECVAAAEKERVAAAEAKRVTEAAEREEAERAAH